MTLIDLPDQEEHWIQLSDGSMISIIAEGHVRISTWAPDGNCVETLVFDRPFNAPHYHNPKP